MNFSPTNDTCFKLVASTIRIATVVALDRTRTVQVYTAFFVHDCVFQPISEPVVHPSALVMAACENFPENPLLWVLSNTIPYYNAYCCKVL